MKVIILCGGIGYRLKEETEFKPKPMVNVGGKPILWHIMKIYSHYGFNDFILALGYKGDYIKDYFLNQKYFTNNFTLFTKSGFARICKQSFSSNKQSFSSNNRENKAGDDFKITFVNTGENTLPGERILKIKPFIPAEDEDFMVTYGDGVGDIDLNELVRFHQKKNKIGTIIGVHPRSKYGLLKTNHSGMINKFIEKPILREWVNGGFMVFKREFFKYLKPGEMEHPALKRLIRKRELSLFVHDGFWHSMDTYPDVDNLNRLWQEDPQWKVWKD